MAGATYKGAALFHAGTALNAVLLLILSASCAARVPSLRLPFYHDNTMSYIKAYNDGKNAPVWDEMTCQSPFGKFPDVLEHTDYTDQCVQRQYNASSRVRNHSSNRLGIVVVVCSEQVGWLRDVDCQDKHIYLYSKCGRPIKHIMDNVGAGKSCLTVVDAPDNIWETLTYAKMHSDYLRHIIDSYNHLEPNLLFLKGSLMLKRGQRHIVRDLTTIINEAMSGEWEFKALGDWRSSLGTHFDRNPLLPGWWNADGIVDEVKWGQELCTLYKRYTCEAECYTCHNCHAPVCFQAHAKGMFMVSSERIRSLPRSEYAWLRQWLHSWDGQGIQRRFMMDVVWSLLFGCDRDGHRRQTETDPYKGCKRGQGWDADMIGKQTKPPKAFLDSEQTLWPIPSTHYKGLPFPFEPKVPRSSSRITFVAVAPPPPTVGTPDGFQAMQLITVGFLAAMLANPDAKLVLLHSPGTAPQNADLSFWAGKLQMVELPTPSDAIWKNPIAHTLAMQIQYLEVLGKQLSESGTRHASMTDDTDGWVMLSEGILVTNPLRSAFELIGSSIGFILTVPSGHPSVVSSSRSSVGNPLTPRHFREHGQQHLRLQVDPSIWFVARSALARAAETVPTLWEKAMHGADADGAAGVQRVPDSFSKDIAQHIGASSTVKTLTSRPIFAGLPCDLYAAHVGPLTGHIDEICRINPRSLVLKLLNNTQAPLVWSWMQSRGSSAFAVPRAIQSLSIHRKKYVSSNINAYENMLLKGMQL